MFAPWNNTASVCFKIVRVFCRIETWPVFRRDATACASLMTSLLLRGTIRPIRPTSRDLPPLEKTASVALTALRVHYPCPRQLHYKKLANAILVIALF